MSEDFMKKGYEDYELRDEYDLAELLGQLHLSPVGPFCSKGIARSPSETLGLVFARGRDLAIPDEQQINAITLAELPVVPKGRYAPERRVGICTISPGD